MRLRRLAVRHFRKLDGTARLDPIGEGLTILSGDNEEGKSTLLAALKCALFEHHAVGGAVREAMAPLGTGLVPEVEVDFLVGGETWQLRKTFRRGGAELTCGTQRFSGDAAEDRLRELLNVQRRKGRSPAEIEHHGLAALFWVDQGTSFGGFAPLAPGRDRIAAAVAGELGALTGGAKTARLAAVVRERCDRYWTPKFKETGALKEAIDRAEALMAEISALRARAAELVGKEERLARLRDPQQRAAEGQAMVEAAARRDEARRRLEGIGAVERQAALATERLKSGRATLAQIEAVAEQRRRKRVALVADEEALRLAAQQVGELRAAFALAAARRDELERADAATRAKVTAAEAEVDRGQRVLQATERMRELGRLETSLAKAREAAEEGGRLRVRVEADPATVQRLTAAREAQGAYDRAAAALAATATTLELRPAADHRVLRAGKPLDPAAPLELTDRTILDLEGWGEVEVIPGGADIAARRGTLAAAADRVAEALRGIGAESLADGERRAAARAALEREAETARTHLAAVIEAAGCTSLDELAAQVAALRVHSAGSAVVEPDAAVTPAIVAAVAERLVAIRRDAATTLVRLREAETQAVEARQRLALVDQEVRRLDGVVAAGRLSLDAAAAERSDESLAIDVDKERSACLVLAGEVEHLVRELRLADGETVRTRLDIAEREIGQLEAERAKRERTIIELESELRAVGEDGLGEKLDEQQGRLDLAIAELGRIRREAMAWKMLHEVLGQALRSDRQALLTPIVQRLDPWLTKLFPDAAPVLDPQSLVPAAIMRAGIEESFGSLSLGTKEQIAILVRLGLGSLLAEREGEAPCLILDDALVYADEGRFETMKAILQRAARDMQILVLTCRPRDYFGLDARYLRLEDCRATST